MIRILVIYHCIQSCADRPTQHNSAFKLNKYHAVRLKGQCHEIFCFWFFFMNQIPPAPEYSIKIVEIRGDIRKSSCTTGINNTGGKFFHQFH
jgi:hypothetical protein